MACFEHTAYTPVCYDPDSNGEVKKENFKWHIFLFRFLYQKTV